MNAATQQATTARIARFTGAMYLIQMATGVFTQVYARGSLTVRGDATQTAQNIIASEQLFRVGIAGDLATYTAVLLATWGLYVLLRPIDRNLAILAVFFRLVELAIHFGATLNSLTLLRLLSGARYLDGIEQPELHALAYLALGAQASAVNVGFILLGFGSAIFGYLFFKARSIPRLLSGWGMFSSILLAAYAVSIVVFPGAASLRLIPMLPMGIYEVSLGLWLLLRGVDARWDTSGKTA